LIAVLPIIRPFLTKRAKAVLAFLPEDFVKVFVVLLKFEWVSFCHIDQLLSVN